MRGPSSVQGPLCVTMIWLALSLTLFLFADADVPRVNSLRPPANSSPSFPADDEIPLFPNAGASSDGTQTMRPPSGKEGSHRQQANWEKRYLFSRTRAHHLTAHSPRANRSHQQR